jgi:hypothetical protein
MLFNGVEVLLGGFTINPSFNSRRFSDSAGRVKHRIRTNNPVNWESKIKLVFDDVSTAMVFIDSVKQLTPYDILLEVGDVDFIAPEMSKAGDITSVYLTAPPKVSVKAYNRVDVTLGVSLNKVGAEAPTVFNTNILWEIPWEWEFVPNVLYTQKLHETYSGTQSLTGNLVSGRIVKFSYVLRYNEYLEVLKYLLWYIRHDQFNWQGEIPVWDKGTPVHIIGFNIKYSGKQMYQVNLTIEEI